MSYRVLRGGRAGFEVWVAPGYFGCCNNNPAQGSFLDPQIGWRKRFAHLVSAKGLPPRAWLRYTRRHAGLAWPIYFAWPYIRQLANVAQRTPRRHAFVPPQSSPDTPTARPE